MSVRLMIVTAEFPHGITEVFFLPELMELQKKCEKLLIVPRSPKKKIIHDIPKLVLDLCNNTPLLNAEICWTALLYSVQHPIRILKALFFLFRGRGLRNLLHNAAVFPKALWLAQVASRENITHIHAHWGTTTSTMAIIASLVTGIPWSMTLHRGDILGNNLLLIKCRKASFVRFISEDGLRLAEHVLGEVLPGQSTVIHLGVAIPDIPLAQGIRKDQKILFCPARLDEIKDHKSLIEASRILITAGVSVQVWLAGDGSQKKALQDYVIKQKLERNILFYGNYPHEAIIDLYKNRTVDIVVISSLYEGVPVALLEAMSYGIPVVGTNVGGTPELLGEGAGLLVPPKNPVALADALMSLIKSEKLQEQLSERGRNQVISGWDARETGRRFLSLIEGSSEVPSCRE